MTLHPTIENVTARIIERSEKTRASYLERLNKAKTLEPARRHLSCSGQAHAYAASGHDKTNLAEKKSGNLGIVTAYNDMLSAHQPFERYPELIRSAAREIGCTAQVAGGVPAMCDGITQGEDGMELSLFSRDVIALSAGVALSHNTFDAAVFLGVCDKIVPGLIIAAATFGHLPAVFIPGGPMESGLGNAEKAKIRQQFAAGEIDHQALMKAEMAAYHGPGTCTFYGTANTNQMLMEFMGLHLPGASFVPANSELRDQLTKASAQRALSLSAMGDHYLPVGWILSEKAFVNGIVGLCASGGSTNLLIHLIAMARAAGILLTWQDFADISSVTPLLARVYPNGIFDVNHFHAAGGIGFLMSELTKAKLLYIDTPTVAGDSLEPYSTYPTYDGKNLAWHKIPEKSLDERILKPHDEPFQATGGLKMLQGNLGEAVMKVSAVDEKQQVIEAPAVVFDHQDQVKKAYKSGLLYKDAIIVVRFQGPKANGMPELHSLTPVLSVLLAKGHKVALLTDGRMSGASGKVASAIHVCPEAVDGGAIAKIQDGDMIRIDAIEGKIELLDETVLQRPPMTKDLSSYHTGSGRELFQQFRAAVSPANAGGHIFGNFS